MHAIRRMRGGSTWLIWAVVGVAVMLLAVLIVVGMGRKRAAARDETAVTEDAGQTNRVNVLRLVPRRVEDRLELPAVVQASAVVDLAAEKGGRIVEVTVDKGAAVSADEVLLHVDRRLWEVNVQEAEIQLRDAKREWERWLKLQASGAVSESDFETVKKRRDLAETALRRAKVHLSQCEVRSPVEGVVNARYVEPGEYLAEGQAVFQVVDLSRLKLELNIPERDVRAMQLGKEATFTVPAAGHQTYTGTISFVAAMASPGSKSFETEITVAQPDAHLRPGMIARVSLVRRMVDDALVVPLEAVVPRKGEHVVFSVRDGYAVRQRVILESIIGQDAVLRSGVSAGEEIVISGQRTLRDGSPVKVVAGVED